MGKIEPFNPASESITAYVERVSLYFEVNDIADAKKVSTFLMLMGAQTYNLVRSLVAPTPPKEKTMEQLIAVLEAHFNPKKLVISERYHFYQNRKVARP